jgi:DNA-binding response OmpR family regulator
MANEKEINAPVEKHDGTSSAKIKILIVEDSPNINLLYDKGLPDTVFEKRFANNGKDGLLVYNDWHPEIIVLDIMLPVMTGYCVLKEIRETTEDKSTTIIMSTSLSEKDDIVSLMKLGIQGYVVKPFSLKEIGGRILKYYEKVDPQKAGAALSIYQKALDEIIKSSLKASLVERDEEDEKLMKIEPDFSADEFTGTVTIEGFCRAFDADNYGLTFKTENNTIARINELLQISNLYEKILEKKKGENLTKSIKKLIKSSELYRTIDFSQLQTDSQKRIKILNLLLLKSIYPDKIPEIKHSKSSA